MKGKQWSKEEIASFCLELSLLLKAGLPAEECFSILGEEEKDTEKKKVFDHLYEKSIYGISIGKAMEETAVFPQYMLQMVSMGEETGYLESVFKSLSVYYEERRRTEQALKETVIFPVILLVMMLAVVLLLVIEVLPVFQDVFAQLGGTLSPLALTFLNMGAVISKGKLFFLLLAAVLLIGGLAVLFYEGTREKWNAFWTKKFSATKTGRLYEDAHFASALYMGVSGGLDLDRSLEMAQSFCDTPSVQEKIERCRDAVQMGTPFAEAIAEEKLMKPMFCRMLAVGVKTGDLSLALEEISRRSEEEASAALTKAASAVEPTVVIILSLVVGVLLLSVMFPLVGIMSSLG